MMVVVAIFMTNTLFYRTACAFVSVCSVCVHVFVAVEVEANAKFEATNQSALLFLFVLIVAHKYITQTVKRQFKVTGLG